MATPDERQLLVLRSEKDTTDLRVPTWLWVGLASLFGIAAMAAVDSYVLKPKIAIAPTDDDPLSEAIDCGEKGSLEFRPVSAIDTGVQKAMRQSFRLLERIRQGCEIGPMPALPLSAEQFIGGQPKNSPTKLSAFHKFSPDCDMETYKLHFEYRAVPEHTSFVVHVFHTIEEDRWELLQSSPAACEIFSGSEALPEMQRTDSKLMRNFASFAVSELALAGRRQGCLKADSTLQLKEVVAAQTSVLNGVQTKLTLILEERSASGTSPPAVPVEVVVLHVCGATEDGRCVNELGFPDDADESKDICALLGSHRPTEQRRLAQRQMEEFRRMGHVNPDPTEMKLAMRRNLMGGDHAQLRPPIAVRRLPGTIEIPQRYDVREDDEGCDKHLAVMNQGDCGSCYAHAFAYMVGSRACRMERKRRRLAEAECTDDPLWSNSERHGCSWYAAHDAGCRRLFDEGQLSHCRKTCGNCPIAPPAPPGKGDEEEKEKEEEDKEENEDKEADEGSQATAAPSSPSSSRIPEFEIEDDSKAIDWMSYLPNPGEFAQCGGVGGCAGGNAPDLWTKLLQNRETDLITRGQSCKPYNLKCWSRPFAVENSYLRYSSCSNYSSLELWDRPCSCIPIELRPKSYLCDAEAPKPECGVTPPFALFRVKGVAEGFSREEGVRNIQRHLLEFGPLYTSMVVTSSFLAWNFRTNPVFTDHSGQRLGGHAAALAGWGALDRHHYWLLRNSWGSDWADGGHFRTLRGVNMLGLEENVFASMPTELYEDHSDIQCEVVEALRSFSLSEHQLETYTWSGRFRCSAPAELVVWISKGDGASIEHISSQPVAGRDSVVTVNIPLHCKGYGLKEGSMDLVIGGKDPRTGRSTDYWQTVIVPPVPGAETVNREWC